MDLNKPVNFRIGFGFDVHRLMEGIPFHLGGVTIPGNKGAVGHSDADVLIHALCDALLGAAGLPDIGFHFPDTDSQYKGIDSKRLLEKTMVLIKSKGFSVGNIDATVCLENPKISPFIVPMKAALAHILEVDESCISIKATTNEKMGFVGREEGVAAYAVVLIK